MPTATDSLETFVMFSVGRKRAGLPPYQAEVWGTGEQAAPLYASPHRFAKDQAIDDARKWLEARQAITEAVS